MPADTIFWRNGVFPLDKSQKETCKLNPTSKDSLTGFLVHIYIRFSILALYNVSAYIYNKV